MISMAKLPFCYFEKNTNKLQNDYKMTRGGSCGMYKTHKKTLTQEAK